jgi:hypothetical protein
MGSDPAAQQWTHRPFAGISEFAITMIGFPTTLLSTTSSRQRPIFYEVPKRVNIRRLDNRRRNSRGFRCYAFGGMGSLAHLREALGLPSTDGVRPAAGPKAKGK